MSILKKITTILFILCITGVSNAYPEAWGQINFSYISINDGLSQSTVFSIAQDKLGNMWFATYDDAAKVRKLRLTPIPYLFRKTLYLCKYSTRYRNSERY